MPWGNLFDRMVQMLGLVLAHALAALAAPPRT
jgi:hypothetical protein